MRRRLFLGSAVALILARVKRSVATSIDATLLGVQLITIETWVVASDAELRGSLSVQKITDALIATARVRFAESGKNILVADRSAAATLPPNVAWGQLVQVVVRIDLSVDSSTHSRGRALGAVGLTYKRDQVVFQSPEPLSFFSAPIDQAQLEAEALKAATTQMNSSVIGPVIRSN